MKYSTGLPSSIIKHYGTQHVPWGPIGYPTYKRTYSRFVPELGRTEEWHETCARACNGLVEIGGLFTEKELEDLYRYMCELKGVISGRALWQLGTDTVEKLGADSLCNCWHCVVNDLEAFCWTFNQLMLGGGVGFNVEPKYVYELPKVAHDPPVRRVETSDCDFIVPDNREGWVELLRRVLQAFFHNGHPFSYSTQCIRPAGKPIFNFGGTASGSEPLVKGITAVINILHQRAGEKLRPIDCIDIMNLIGTIVVSGNVRRSSQIAIGDPNDKLFLDAKNWNKHPVPNWRNMSNNTVACNRIDELLPEYWEPYYNNGECYGLINLDNCRRYGRLIDSVDYRPDYGVTGTNPCAEIPLSDMEPCTLAECFLPRLANKEEWLQMARLLYKATKTITNYNFISPETEEVVHQNFRVGISLSGWMQCLWRYGPEELSYVYRGLEEADDEYSHLLGIPTSVKLTTVKPAGTTSLLPGITPGMHAAYSRYMIRRIRFSANDPLVEVCKQHGYQVEPQLQLDGSQDVGTMVVEFPVDMGESVTEDKVSAVDQLETQKFLQTYWADNSISCTHYFKSDEVEVVKGWLERNYASSVKTCSFMHSKDHGFKQAPLERLTREEYEKRRSMVTPITYITEAEQRDTIDNLECEGGSCPVK